MQMQSGSQGFSGRRALNSRTGLGKHFVFEDSDDLIGTMIEDIEPIKVKYTPDQALNTLFSFS
jgi:hypothetical protein